jgi:hypothetical protein
MRALISSTFCKGCHVQGLELWSQNTGSGTAAIVILLLSVYGCTYVCETLNFNSFLSG